MKFTDVSKYVKQAIDCGFRHIDTAICATMLVTLRVRLLIAASYVDYQTEKYVGAAIRESGLPRSSFYITTKYDGDDVVRKRAQESLEQVGSLLI